MLAKAIVADAGAIGGLLRELAGAIERSGQVPRLHRGTTDRTALYAVLKKHAPDELAAWFEQFDGQQKGSSITPPGAPPIRLLSQREAIAIRKTCPELAPFDPDLWLPIADLGEQRYAVYFCQDDSSGWVAEMPSEKDPISLDAWLDERLVDWDLVEADQENPGAIVLDLLRLMRTPMGWYLCEIHQKQRAQVADQLLRIKADCGAVTFRGRNNQQEIEIRVSHEPRCTMQPERVLVELPEVLLEHFARAAADRSAKTARHEALPDFRIDFVER